MQRKAPQSNASTLTPSERRAERDAVKLLEREQARRDRVSCSACGVHVRGKRAGVCGSCETATRDREMDPWIDREITARGIATMLDEQSRSFMPHTLYTACDAVIFALEALARHVTDADECARVGVALAKSEFESSLPQGCDDAEADDEPVSPETEEYLCRIDDEAWEAMRVAAADVVRRVDAENDPSLWPVVRAAARGLAYGDTEPTGVRWNPAHESCDSWATRVLKTRREIIEREVEHHIMQTVDGMRGDADGLR